MPSHQTKNQHLLWRAGFGPAAEQLTRLKEENTTALFKSLQKASAEKPAYIDVADSYLKDLMAQADDNALQKIKQLDADNRKMIQEKQRESLKNLNLHWLNEMVHSKAQLREKMAFFWHGHFASRNVNIFYQQGMLDILRQNALGSFRDLLHAVSKSAAMLNFLNAQQNKKGHPNENFAREVMELFTMGRGNYTEADIKEAARAFTGWGANVKGEFVFRKFQHDDEPKTIFGKTGSFSGEDVLNMLLDHKATATFITQKIYRFFVNDTVDVEKTTWLANRFYKSDYNIARLMEDIFTADWFYHEKNMGNKIKSPVELMVGIQRMLPMQVQNEEAFLLLQRILGQLLFYPPNVAGWPGGTNWIDSSTLMMRLRIPQLINDNDDLNVRPKIDDDQMMGRTDGAEMEPNAAKAKRGYAKVGKPIKASIDWSRFTKNFDNVSKENLAATLSNTLLQTKPGFSMDILKSYTDNSAREAFIKSTAIQLMSTPEYQMC